MKIVAVPDPEDEDLDPVDPLGSIRIEDEEGAVLNQGSIFLDDWFTGLLSGMHRLQGGGLETVVELYSEGGRLEWKPGQGGSTVVFTSYRGNTSKFRIIDMDAFEAALRNAVLEFTDKYKTHRNWPICTELVALRNLALNKQTG